MEASSPLRSAKSDGDNAKSSDSDEPIPSVEWPTSSPERVVLPPDSSLDSAKNLERDLPKQRSTAGSNREFTTGIEGDFSTRHGRLSNGSTSSSLDMSPRPILPRAVKLNDTPCNRSSRASSSSQDQSALSDTTHQSSSCRPAKLTSQSDDHSHKASTPSQRRSPRLRRSSSNADKLPDPDLRKTALKKGEYDRRFAAQDHLGFSAVVSTRYFSACSLAKD